jgi:hypothetical protein
MTNIINIAEKKKKKEEETEASTPKAPVEEYDFQADMERAKKLKERKAKERLEANKSVLRSYRIKSK